MKNTLLRVIAAGLLLCLVLALGGCGERPPAGAAEVLSAMTDGLNATHTGKSYSRTLAETDGAYLSDTLFSALFGEASRGLLSGTEGALPAINDAAVRLSVSPTPVELAVLRCSDARGTATAAGIARARLDTVRRAWVGTEWETLCAEGTVTVEEGYVLLIIAENPDRLLREARQMIRKGG